MKIEQKLDDFAPKKYSVRFNANPDDGIRIVDSIYVLRAALPPDRIPKEITITLEYEDA
jgi:hypothetical protein